MLGSICPQCCASGREESIDCPFACEYLVESREHEKPQPLDRTMYPDLFPSGEFIDANQELFGILCVSLFTAIPDLDQCIDRDLHDCLEASVEIWRMRAAGLESAAPAPSNPRAAAILEKLQERLAVFQGHREEEGRSLISAKDMLSMTVFLRVFGQAQDNGRSRGRSFLQYLGLLAMQFLPNPEEGQPQAAEPAPLIV